MKPTEQNILIVDDDQLILEMMSEMLLRMGFPSVQCADNGMAALKLIDSNDKGFDLILCDLEMPEMDGIELMRHLGERDFNGGVVLMTGTKGEIMHTVLNLGKVHTLKMLGTLNKPVTEEALKKLLELQTKARTMAKAGTVPIFEITAEELEWALDSEAFIND